MNRTLYKGIMDGLVIDQILRDEAFNMPTKHFHPEYELYYLLEGSRYYFIENESYLVEKGSLVIINRQQIHKTGPAGSALHERILIELSHAPFSTFFSKLSPLSLNDFFCKYKGIWVLDENGQKYVEALLATMMTEIKNKCDHYEVLTMMKLTELLIYIIRCNNESPNFSTAKPSDTPKHKMVHEVAHYIITHYQTTLSLEDLARRFFINKSYLSRIFKEVTGYTVNEFINVNRIKHAQNLLVSSDLTICEIAVLSGYESHTYFERVFKKYLDTSPLKYRKKNNPQTKPL